MLIIDCISGDAFLFRGDPPSKGSGSTKPGWTYLTESQLVNFMGTSLSKVIPKNRPRIHDEN